MAEDKPYEIIKILGYYLHFISLEIKQRRELAQEIILDKLLPNLLITTSMKETLSME